MKLLYRTRDYAFIISAMGKLLVTVFAFAPAHQDKIVMVFAPGLDQLLTIQLLHRDKFLAPR